MSTVGTPEADISHDVAELAFESWANTSEALLAESMGNVASANSVVRHSGARKFNQEDPMEAAAAEKILKTS